MYNISMATMTVSEARAALPEILDRVLAGEEVTITRHGTAVAVVVRPDLVRIRRADRALGDAERLRDLLDRGRATPLSETPTIAGQRADELVTHVIAARSTR
jgi:antitoxin (DNA-binding transcriptional repressor) of toxin-antitoxin stability system